MLAEGSVQEVMDLAGVAHLSAIKGRVSVHQLLRRFPYISRNPEDRELDEDDLRSMVSTKSLEKFR